MNSITGPQAFFQIVPAFDRLLSRGLWAVALAFLSVGGWLSYDEAAPVDRPQLASAVASVRNVDETPGSSREAAPVEYLSKPISQLRTMHDRVLAHNPLPGDTESPLTDVNPRQWRVVTLQHVQPGDCRTRRAAGRDQRRRVNGIFQPFEGDGTMSIILSKAFLLADDTKIKDATIVSQIKR